MILSHLSSDFGCAWVEYPMPIQPTQCDIWNHMGNSTAWVYHLQYVEVGNVYVDYRFDATDSDRVSSGINMENVTPILVKAAPRYGSCIYHHS